MICLSSDLGLATDLNVRLEYGAQEKWVCSFWGKTREVKAASFKRGWEITISPVDDFSCLHQCFNTRSLLVLTKFNWETVYLRRKEALGHLHRGGICRYTDPHLPTPPPPNRQHHLNLAPHAHLSADQKRIKRRVCLKHYWQFNKMLMPLPALRPSTIFFLSLKPTLSKVSTTLKRQREENGTH